MLHYAYFGKYYMYKMSEAGHRYFIINKPPNMVSQFVSSHDVVLLGDLGFPFPEGIHAIGRLDSHSEGLLILTTDKSVTKRLFQGNVPHTRTYLVQVKHVVTADTIAKLNSGVSIQIKGGEYYTTAPCNAMMVTNPEKYVAETVSGNLYDQTSWIMLSLTEGKFHQVRKMVDALGHRCKRLIRISIEGLVLGDLKRGEVREIDQTAFFKFLKL